MPNHLEALTGLKLALFERIDLWWWSLPTADQRAMLLRDYVLGLPSAIAQNIQQSERSLEMWREKRTAQDWDFSQSIRATGAPYSDLSRRDAITRRGIDIRAMSLAMYVSASAAVDGLAALTVGVLGLPTAVIRADIGTLFKRPHGREFTIATNVDPQRRTPATELTNIQASALTEMSASFRDAGPAGWLDWLLDQRNTLVHREHRMDVTSAVQERRAWHFYNLAPRQPEQSNMEALHAGRSGGLPDLYLMEDHLTTAGGLLASTVEAVVRTSETLTQAWERRSSIRPEIPWERQWRDPRVDPRFAGYAPGSARIDDSSQLHMHPESARRLREGGVLGDN